MTKSGTAQERRLGKDFIKIYKVIIIHIDGKKEIGRDVPSSTLNTTATLKELFLNSISLLLTLESKYWARCTHGFRH